jgi:ABC-2 type transport system permease protein
MLAPPRRPDRRTQLWAVLRKETLQTVSDKRLVFMLLFAPTVQLLVFGYAIDFKVDRLPTVIADQDRTQASREHLRRLLADGTLTRAGTVASPVEAEQAIEGGRAAAAILIPPGFERALGRGETARLQVLLDGSDPNRSNVAAAAVTRYVAEAGVALRLQRLAERGVQVARPPGLELRPRIWFNPQLDTPPYMIPGIMAMLLVVVTTIVTAMGLAREREMGTLEQVLVTPIRPWVLLVGKMLPFVVIGVFDVLFALTVGAWLFAVPLRGSLVLVGGAALLYLMSTLGVGLLISTVSRTQQQSFLGGFLFAMPAILLSGVMTPIAAMPRWLQLITYANPLRYFVEVMRGTLLAGAGVEILWPNLLVLACFGVALLGVASLRFQKRIA